jgi:hypothetical protein
MARHWLGRHAAAELALDGFPLGFGTAGAQIAVAFRQALDGQVRVLDQFAILGSFLRRVDEQGHFSYLLGQLL